MDLLVLVLEPMYLDVMQYIFYIQNHLQIHSAVKLRQNI